jgi:hypothetical protein
VTHRFATHGGAVVAVLQRTRNHNPEHRWECRGCDANTTVWSEHLKWTIEAANKHAGECRSMPKPGGAR